MGQARALEIEHKIEIDARPTKKRGRQTRRKEGLEI